MICSGNIIKAGVMGWPIDHSRSPLMHNYWLKQYGIDGEYLPLPVPPGEFAEALRNLPTQGFAGVNVTIPHKEVALALVDVADETASRIGAVNTIIVHHDQRLEGRNTDGFGFIENLNEAAPTWRDNPGPIAILGAGGAVRAICRALKEVRVAQIRLINRSTSKAYELAAELADDFPAGVQVIPWSDRVEALAGASLLVNGTSLGMAGCAGLDLSLDLLPLTSVVCDIVYVPLETPLLRAAALRGNRVVDGLGMLMHQGRPGFEAWFGVRPKVTPELRRLLVRNLNRERVA